MKRFSRLRKYTYYNAEASRHVDESFLQAHSIFLLLNTNDLKPTNYTSQQMTLTAVQNNLYLRKTNSFTGLIKKDYLLVNNFHNTDKRGTQKTQHIHKYTVTQTYNNCNVAVLYEYSIDNYLFHRWNVFYNFCCILFCRIPYTSCKAKGNLLPLSFHSLKSNAFFIVILNIHNLVTYFRIGWLLISDQSF